MFFHQRYRFVGFQCKGCGKSYRYRSTLRTHQKLECGKEPQNACHLCNYRCYQRGNLKRHLLLKHEYLVPQ